MKIFHSAHSPDDLAAKLARLEELERDFSAAVERAKLAAVKEFAYGAGHEINNPLANISARAQTLLREEPNHDKRHKLATIIAQAQRAHEMITDLMLFAKPPKLKLEPVNLQTWLPSILSDLQKSAEEKQHRFIFDAGAIAESENLELKLDPVQMAVAIRAIVTNSLEAMQTAGEIHVKIFKSSREIETEEEIQHSDQQCVSQIGIVIRDTGPGMSAETREHLFDPFFSGREAGRGLGFGLCKAWRVVDEHGGRIDVESELGNGTKITLWLPCNS